MKRYSLICILLLGISESCRSAANSHPIEHTFDSYYNHKGDGLNISVLEEGKAKTIATIPYGAKVKLLQRFSPACPAIGSTQNQMAAIQYQAKEGCINEKFINLLPPKADFTQFTGGCVSTTGCDGCGVLKFLSDHTFIAALGCVERHLGGRWRTTQTEIIAEVQIFNGCPEIQYPNDTPCESGIVTYQKQTRIDSKLIFKQSSNGRLTCTETSKMHQLCKRLDVIGLLQSF